MKTKKLIVTEGIKFSVKNWDKFQHYGGHRNPPWVKLYNSLLDDLDFYFLSPNTKLLYIFLLLFASKTGNHMTLNFQFLSSKTNISVTEETIRPLFEKEFLLAACKPKASKSLATCEQDASSDKNRLDKKRKEEKKSEEREQNPFLNNFKKSSQEKTVVPNESGNRTNGEVIDSHPQLRNLVDSMADAKSWP